MSGTPLPDALSGYNDFRQDPKARIQTAQVRAALAVNRSLVELNWQIGREILTRQEQYGYGAKVVGRLGKDLQTAFPEAYPDAQFVQQAAGQIPWFHNCIKSKVE